MTDLRRRFTYYGLNTFPLDLKVHSSNEFRTRGYRNINRIDLGFRFEEGGWRDSRWGH